MGSRESIAIDVQKLADVHGRSLRAPAIAHWVTRLEPFAERPSYRRVINEFLDGARFPALADVVSALQSSGGNDWKPKASEPRTPRTDQAAIMSMLWLHYECGWNLRVFAGSVLGRVFGKDPFAALVTAIGVYSREDVQAWMQAEKDRGN